MIQALIDYFRGVYHVEAETPDTGAFLTQCGRRGAHLRRVRKTDGAHIRALVYRRDMKKVRASAEKTGGSLRVIKSTGIMNLLGALLPKRTFLIMAALSVILCKGSSLFLWNIDIRGCEKTDEEELLSALEEKGLKRGRLTSSVDVRDICLDIMRERDDLAYITVNIKGTEARVDVHEKRDPPPKEEVIEDIVSCKDGIAEDVLVFSGRALVKRHDTVAAGDTLVSCLVTDENGIEHRVAPKAEITLRTWRRVSFAMASDIYGFRETGEKKSFYSLELGGGRRYFDVIEKMPFACYYKIKASESFGFGRRQFPLFRLVKETYVECEPYLLEVTDERRSEILESSCRKAIGIMTGGGTVKESRWEYRESEMCGVMEAECVENAVSLRQFE